MTDATEKVWASTEPCTACNWTPELQSQCHYESHVRLFYGASTRGIWSIGSDVILKERPSEGPKAEVRTLKYLARHASGIPVPRAIRDWVDSKNRYFVMTERIQEQTLEEAWSSLSIEKKTAIADQLVDVRQQLRALTSPAIQDVDGEPCVPALLIPAKEPMSLFHSDAELWDAINLHLQKLNVPPKASDSLRARFPKCKPYVLTHCDLNLDNVIVKDGKLAGILDWEFAAFNPIWYEYVSASWGWTEEDYEWKKLLQGRMRQSNDGYEEAEEFWRDLRKMKTYPNLDEKGKEVSESLLEGKKYI
ncbi:aminoglycoside phosphotransferase family protein [Aspergillus stella-maris]|uniref:aminoglycoside phosphotransferase family protein n=1 Tax=Aspergillus stella-maris TaxID=1810926 RepID=UPI003CCDE84B